MSFNWGANKRKLLLFFVALLFTKSHVFLIVVSPHTLASCCTTYQKNTLLQDPRLLCQSTSGSSELALTAPVCLSANNMKAFLGISKEIVKSKWLQLLIPKHGCWHRPNYCQSERFLLNWMPVNTHLGCTALPLCLRLVYERSKDSECTQEHHSVLFGPNSSLPCILCGHFH